MVDFIVSKTEGGKLIVSEKQLSNHHSSTSLDLVSIEVETLQVGALFQRLSNILCSVTLNMVSHQVQIEKSM